MTRRLLIVLFTLALAATACGGGDGGDVTATDADTATVDDTGTDTDSGDGVDDCGEGKAFPDDPDFREAICRPLMAMTDLIGTDATIDPEWGSRISMAMLNYANRDEAMAELAAVLAEIEAAG